MFSNNRHAYRQFFSLAWQKYQKKLPLEPLEVELVKVILLHPEYHVLLQNQKEGEQQEFQLEENPFFHMSLHLSIREQIKIDKPQGILKVYQALSLMQEDKMDVEHKMMQCLATTLWKAQQSGKEVNETDYLNALNALLETISYPKG